MGTDFIENKFDNLLRITFVSLDVMYYEVTWSPTGVSDFGLWSHRYRQFWDIEPPYPVAP